MGSNKKIILKKEEDKKKYLQKGTICDSIDAAASWVRHFIKHHKSRVDIAAMNTCLDDRIHHYGVQLPVSFFGHLYLLHYLQNNKIKKKKNPSMQNRKIYISRKRKQGCGKQDLVKLSPASELDDAGGEPPEIRFAGRGGADSTTP